MQNNNYVIFNILNHINYLFSRSSLPTNTYLSRQLKPNLEIPLFIIIQQRKLSQITKDQNFIINAIQMSQLIRYNAKDKTIRIIDYPTIRINAKDTYRIKDIQKHFYQKNLKYLVTEVYEGNGDILITLYKQGSFQIFEEIISLVGKIQYQKSTLYEEIKEGIAKFKKNKKVLINKQQQQQQQQSIRYYNISYPLNVFIRRAVDTDSEDQAPNKALQTENKIHIVQDKVTKDKNSQHKAVITDIKRNQSDRDQQKQQSSYKNGNKGKKQEIKDKKKYKQVVNVVLNSQDFPTLE